jgi:hypothetical protein
MLSLAIIGGIYLMPPSEPLQITVSASPVSSLPQE